MKIASATDKGLVRAVNQDSFAAAEVNGKVWATVCDGMGGAKGGGVASANATKRIAEAVHSCLQQGATPTFIRNALRSALENANIVLYDMANKNEQYAGMGTTSVTVAVADSICYYAHVGDSRLYLLRNDSLTQLTVDHSIVQSMVETGQLTPSEAKTHPRKNIITRAIGVDENVLVDVGECRVISGDMLLLCSDGLTNYAEIGDIKEIMNNTSFDDIPQKLIDKANSGGGGDNITAVVIKIQ